MTRRQISRDRPRGGAVRRVLRLLRHLEASRLPVRLQYLADELEVSTRTIRRDLEILETLGGIVTLSGPGCRSATVRFCWALDGVGFGLNHVNHARGNGGGDGRQAGRQAGNETTRARR